MDIRRVCMDFAAEHYDDFAVSHPGTERPI